MSSPHRSVSAEHTDLNLDELVRTYHSMLHAIGHQYRLTPEELDDAIQSTWLALCQHHRQIRDPQRVPGWLATTMRRSCIAAYHNRNREQLLAEPPGTMTSSAPPVDISTTVVQRYAVQRLYEAIGRLPDRQRRLIQIQLGPAQPDYAQISRSMPIPLGSIGPVRGRALRRLRVLLADLEAPAT